MEPFEIGGKWFISDGAYVTLVNKTPQTISMPEHHHDFIEFIYILKGKCTHIIDDVEYHVKHGDFLVVNYNQMHRIEGNSDVTFVNILLKPEYVNKNIINQENAFALLRLSEFEDFSKTIDQSKCKVTFSGEERDTIETIISIMNTEMQQKSSGYDLAVRSQINLMLLMLFRKMSLKLENSFMGISDDLLNYIRHNCHEKLTLEGVAKLCGYSTSYFSRVFKKNSGVSFTEFLKKSRIENAANMLLSTQYNVTDILFRVGYTDKTKFFSHFKEIKGVSPLKFRKQKCT